MKVIDLLNKIANGEEVPKKIRIEHWCYKFEWVEHLENYYDEDSDIDIMSALSMSEEELNYKVEIIEEKQDIEYLGKQDLYVDDARGYSVNIEKFGDKINELIKEVNKLKNNEEVL